VPVQIARLTSVRGALTHSLFGHLPSRRRIGRTLDGASDTRVRSVPTQIRRGEVDLLEGARVMRAPPYASFHFRNVLNEARTSSVKILGCSHAAKWQPLGVRP